MDKKLEFPKGFFWGAATSAHQVEGNNHNDWTQWEKVNAERLSKESGGKYPRENYISGRACDHYNRYEEDFDLAKEMGHNAHRFSIEWSRIEPEEGKFNEQEIEHYQTVIDELKKRGLEAFVTVWHNSSPIWIRNIGGWENSRTVYYFSRYVDKISRSLRGVNFWMSLNEPGIYVGLGYIQGQQPPGVKSFKRAYKVFKNFINAHRNAYRIIHEIHPETKVGIAHYMVWNRPYKNLPWNNLIVWVLNYLRNTWLLNSIKNSNDFIGLNYYHTDFLNFKFGKGKWWFIELFNPNKWINDLGWQIYPEGIYHMLKRASIYKKPIYITENGVADSKDVHRERFIKEHLWWVHKAIEERMDVRGYFHWSLLDNFEMNRLDGFWPRFGLIEIDYETLERKPRPSSMIYAEIAKSNSIKEITKGGEEE